MAENKILPFAGGASNILTQAEYAADAERGTGHTAGSIARSPLQNKVLKQASLVAAAIGKFVADNQATAVDDGTLTVDTLATMIAEAILSAVPDASTTVKGKVELATSAETQTGTDTARAVTPAGLSARTANTTRTGVVELATNAETQTGTDATRAVTPAGLSARTATTARTGVVELATEAEAEAGTDTERAVTPAGLAAALVPGMDLDSPGYYTLPGGLIFQWGTVSSTGTPTVTFPIPFPNECFGAQINGTSRVDCGVDSVSTTGLIGNAGGGGETLWWFAYGH